MTTVFDTIRTEIRKLAAVAMLALVGSPVWAAPPLSGTIYYVRACCRTMRTMDPNGGNLTVLGVGTYGPPSYVMYGGHRWFLNTREILPREYYPDGSPRVEVFAFRDDYDFYINNNPNTAVQLTNDITLQTYGDGFYSVHWVPGGHMVSMIARRWYGTAVGEGGIFTAPLELGLDGEILGLAAQPSGVTIGFPLDANQWPNVRTYGWDPSGTKVAYDNAASLGVADSFGGPGQTIYSGPCHTPQWAPDGTRIAFTDPTVGISTIKPDGTGVKQIARRTSGRTYDRPFWSPSSSHLIFYGLTASTGDLEIYRASANGTSLTNLTNTPGGATTAEHPMGWR